MELTLGLLDYLIRQEFKTQHSGRFNARQIIHGIRLPVENMQVLSVSDKNILYLKDGTGRLLSSAEEDVEAVSGNTGNTVHSSGAGPQNNICRSVSEKVPGDLSLTLTVLSESEFRALAPCHSGYYLDNAGHDFFTIFNHLQNILDRFRLWQLHIMELSQEPDRMQNMLELISSYLQINVYIMSREYHGDYISNSLDDSDWRNYYNAQNDLNADGVQSLYLQDPDFDRTFEKRGLTKWVTLNTEDPEKTIYYYNIFLKEKYTARIIYVDCNARPESVFEDVLIWLSRMIETSYLNLLHRQREYEEKQVVRDYLETMINGTAVSLEQLAPIIGGLNWKVQDTYLVIKLVPQSYANSSLTMDYYSSQLEALTGGWREPPGPGPCGNFWSHRDPVLVTTFAEPPGPGPCGNF